MKTEICHGQYTEFKRQLDIYINRKDAFEQLIPIISIHYSMTFCKDAYYGHIEYSALIITEEEETL